MDASQKALAEGMLFTDLYELTMAQLYLEEGMADTPAQFDVFYREEPDYGRHKAGYCVFAGTDDLLDWMQRADLGDAALARLAALRGPDGEAMFRPPFLAWLREQRGFEAATVRAVAEGRVVHAGTPLAVVEGPLALAQLLETSTLNHLNYATLVATRATRVKQAARGRPVLDFGMRRGHASGVNAGTRAALIGGVDASSNTGISLGLGVPPRGTHAHSLVQAFQALGGGELDAFRAYARAYPDDCLLLLDTVDTLGSGLPNAIRVFEELRDAGHRPAGVRLDSGDLAHLAIVCARELDAAGFADATITLSSQLDELTIWQILQQIDEEAPHYGVDPAALSARLAYGVGTRLITSAGDASLDGVYKLVALRSGGAWRPSVKRSDTPAKATNPGAKGLYRVYDERGMATADLVTLADEEPSAEAGLELRHPTETARRRLPPERITRLEPLHEEVWHEGARRARPAPLRTLRERRRADEERLDPGVRRLLNPHIYHVSLSPRLWELKRSLLSRDGGGGAPPDPAV